MITTEKNSPQTTEKLQKILARAGLGSRREIEDWIHAGRVTMDGKVAKIGDRAEAGSKISVDGKPVSAARQQPKFRVMLYHKPSGQICTHEDPEGRPTVFDALPILRQGKWLSIGRLDFNTSGLLMFTTSGDFANRFMHPSNDLEREYAVRILGSLEPEQLQMLLDGIMLDDGLARCESVEPIGGTGANHWYRVIVKEGRNRLVRRLFAHFNLTVNRLMRTRFGPVILPPQLKQGRHEELSEPEIRDLLAKLQNEPLKIA